MIHAELLLVALGSLTMDAMVTSIADSIERKPDPAQARAGGLEVHARCDAGTNDATVPSSVTMTNDSQREMCLTGSCLTESDCRNQQFSITAVTTSAGAVTERYAYTAYGLPTILDASASVLSSSAISNRYTYTGREWDATLALHHFRARWMSPIAGRFLGRDPIHYRDAYNLYQFVELYVLSGLDPTGNLSQKKISNVGQIPENGPCGQYFVTFEWVLSEEEKREGGIIVQLVTNSKNCFDCPKDGGGGQKIDCKGRSWPELEDEKFKPINQQLCDIYWEMWEVPKDGKEPDIPLKDSFADPGCSGYTSGSSKKTGQAVFIPNTKLTPDVLARLRAYVKTGEGGARGAHSLPSLCKDDENFLAFNHLLEDLGYDLKLLNDTTKKQTIVKWNCCPKFDQYGNEIFPKNSKVKVEF